MLGVGVAMLGAAIISFDPAALDDLPSTVLDGHIMLVRSVDHDQGSRTRKHSPFDYHCMGIPSWRTFVVNHILGF